MPADTYPNPHHKPREEPGRTVRVGIQRPSNKTKERAMPTIATGKVPSVVTFHNPDPGAIVGTWCKAPLEPDRCEECKAPAVGYYIDGSFRVGLCGCHYNEYHAAGKLNLSVLYPVNRQ